MLLDLVRTEDNTDDNRVFMVRNAYEHPIFPIILIHLLGGEATAPVVPCSAVAGRHGRSGLGAARRRHPGAAGRRATAGLRVATFSPSLRFLPQSTHPRASHGDSSAVHRPLLP